MRERPRAAAAWIAALAAAVIACGCSDPGREARELNAKYPVSAEVLELQKSMGGLANDKAARDALEREQATWLTNRAAHCLALARLQGTAKDDSKKAVEEVKTCFVGVDAQRADAMRSTKLVALLQQPPVVPVKALTVRMSVPFQRGESPGELCVSPDGGLLAIGKTMGDIEIYDTRTGQLLRVMRTGKYTYLGNLQFSPNGRVLFVSSWQHRGLKIYDPYTGELLREYDGLTNAFVLLPGARYLLHGDKHSLLVYDIHANKAAETPFAERAYVSKIAVSDDGKRAVTLSTNRKLTLWDIAATDSGVALSMGAQTEVEIQQFTVGKLEFTRSGDALLAITQEGFLTRWSVPDLKRAQDTAMGRIIAGELLRLPDSNRVVVPGTAADGQISHVLFWDLDKDIAATVALSRHGNGLQIAWTPFAPFLYLASIGGISVLDMPDERSYRPSAQVLDTLLDSRQAERISANLRNPELRNLASDATIEAIGVYQGQATPGAPRQPGAGSGRPTPRPVNVVVGKTDRPVILVLSSYDPVEWVITPLADARVKHILLTSYHDSLVVSRRPVQTTKIGRTLAYEARSSGYDALDAAVRQYLGKGIDRFQGAYSGTEFRVGTIAPSAVSSRAPGTMYRCADSSGGTSFVDRPCAELGLSDRGVVAPPPRAPQSGPASASAPGSAQGGQPGSRQGYSIQGGSSGAVSVAPGVTISPGPRPHERVIRCGGDTIICDANDTVICRGKQIPCR